MDKVKSGKNTKEIEQDINLLGFDFTLKHRQVGLERSRKFLPVSTEKLDREIDIYFEISYTYMIFQQL